MAMRRHTSTAIALEDSEVMVLSREALWQLRREDIELFALLMMNIARELARRLKLTDDILLGYMQTHKDGESILILGLSAPSTGISPRSLPPLAQKLSCRRAPWDVIHGSLRSSLVANRSFNARLCRPCYIVLTLNAAASLQFAEARLFVPRMQSTY